MRKVVRRRAFGNNNSATAENIVDTKEKCKITASGLTPFKRFSPSIAMAVVSDANTADAAGRNGTAPSNGRNVTPTPITAHNTASHTPDVGFSRSNGHDSNATHTGKVFVNVRTVEVSIFAKAKNPATMLQLPEILRTHSMRGRRNTSVFS